MTPITLKRIDESHFAGVYHHGKWAGIIAIRTLPVDDQLRVMGGETIVVDLVIKDGE